METDRQRRVPYLVLAMGASFGYELRLPVACSGANVKDVLGCRRNGTAEERIVMLRIEDIMNHVALLHRFKL